MEIIIGILDALLTCTIISKIYSQICKTSKKERYISERRQTPKMTFVFLSFQK